MPVDIYIYSFDVIKTTLFYVSLNGNEVRTMSLRKVRGIIRAQYRENDYFNYVFLLKKSTG